MDDGHGDDNHAGAAGLEDDMIGRWNLHGGDINAGDDHEMHGTRARACQKKRDFVIPHLHTAIYHNPSTLTNISVNIR